MLTSSKKAKMLTALKSYKKKFLDRNLTELDESGTSAKYKKLLMKSDDIGEGFIERDLRDSQYIAKKAKQILEGICRIVISTSGSVTDRLREDWDLVNVMQELNMEKYRKLGHTDGLIWRYEKK